MRPAESDCKAKRVARLKWLKANPHSWHPCRGEIHNIEKAVKGIKYKRNAGNDDGASVFWAEEEEEVEEEEDEEEGAREKRSYGMVRRSQRKVLPALFKKWTIVRKE